MGIQAYMGTDFKQRRRALRMWALIATICWSAVAGRTDAKAQEPPSIVGSSPLYGLSGATGWINSTPLSAKQLKGKVVLVDFWTYCCIDCLRSLPYMNGA
jgi:hypothetical protein